MFILALAIILAVVWLKTGRDPLYWLIRALIVLRAALSLAIATLAYAAKIWWQDLPAAIHAGSREVQG